MIQKSRVTVRTPKLKLPLERPRADQIDERSTRQRCQTRDHENDDLQVKKEKEKRTRLAMQRGFALAFIKSAVAGVRADSAKLRFKKSYDGLTIKSGTGHTLRRRLYPQRNHIFFFFGGRPAQ